MNENAVLFQSGGHGSLGGIDKLFEGAQTSLKGGGLFFFFAEFRFKLRDLVLHLFIQFLNGFTGDGGKGGVAYRHKTIFVFPDEIREERLHLLGDHPKLFVVSTRRPYFRRTFPALSSPLRSFCVESAPEFYWVF